MRGVVERLHDGHFIYKGPMNQGAPGDIGRAVVLRVGGVRVVLNENRLQNFDPEIFRCLSIEPTEQKIVVVKSVVHFRPPMTLASLVVEADGPGICSLDFTRFPYQHIPRPMYGIDAF